MIFERVVYLRYKNDKMIKGALKYGVVPGDLAYRAAESARLTKESFDRLIARSLPIVTAVTYNVLFTNDIVVGLIKDASEKIRNSGETGPLRCLKRVERAVSEYESLTIRIVGERSDYFADANTLFTEDLEPHISRLTYSIKRVFDRFGLKNPYMLAKTETARTMCEFACVQTDRRVAELVGIDSRFRRINIGYLRQTDILNRLNSLSRAFRIPKEVNLDTEECRKMMDEIAVKLADGKIIANAIKTELSPQAIRHQQQQQNFVFHSS